MRKYMERIIDAFGATRTASAPSAHTDGMTIWSYGTAIATLHPDGEGIILNATRYSATTSSQVAAIRRSGYAILAEVAGLGRGATRDDLLRAAVPVEA